MGSGNEIGSLMASAFESETTNSHYACLAGVCPLTQSRKETNFRVISTSTDLELFAGSNC